MPKVLLIEVTRSIDYDDWSEGYNDEAIHSKLITEYFEEVSEDDLALLKSWVRKQPHSRSAYYRLIELKNIDIPMAISEAIQIAKKEEKNRLAKEKRNKIAAEKRKKTLAENKKKRDLAKLKKLQEELGIK